MNTRIEDRTTRPSNPSPDRRDADQPGPARPDVDRPAPNDMMRRMKKVDPDAAKKYRQRSGQ